jgi:hypothetical protein
MKSYRWRWSIKRVGVVAVVIDLLVACTSDREGPSSSSTLTDAATGADATIDAGSDADSSPDTTARGDAPGPDAGSSDEGSTDGPSGEEPEAGGTIDSSLDVVTDSSLDVVTDSSLDVVTDSSLDVVTDSSLDVVTDSSLDVVEEMGMGVGGESGSSTQGILGSLGGPDCLACAQDSGCVDMTLDNCEVLGGQVADAGPALGSSMQDLCYSALGCILQSGCATAASVLNCYCGAAPIQSCIGGVADGRCMSQEEDGLQTAVPTQVLASFTSAGLGAGIANRIAACLRGPASQSTLTCPSCFH